MTDAEFRKEAKKVLDELIEATEIHYKELRRRPALTDESRDLIKGLAITLDKLERLRGEAEG